MAQQPALAECYKALIYAALRRAVADAARGDKAAAEALREPFWASRLDEMTPNGAARVMALLASRRGRETLRRRTTTNRE